MKAEECTRYKHVAKLIRRASKPEEIQHIMDVVDQRGKEGLVKIRPYEWTYITELISERTKYFESKKHI